MSDISILLDEQNQLTFDVEVQGVSNKGVQPRFIIETDGMDISFDGKFTDNKVTVDLPILANTLETDQYKCRLEFIVEGEKIFTPMKASIDAVLPVKVRAGIKGSNKIIETTDNNIHISGVKMYKEEVVQGMDDITEPVEMKKEFETKDFGLDFKFKDDTGSFTGYGAMFGNVDSHNDIIKPGAFTKTLSERKNVKLLWQHNQQQPIGTFVKMYEDNAGLVVEGKLALDVKQGQEAYSLMKMGGIEGLSIGYRVVKATIDRKSGIRHIEEVKLFEVSVVTFPSNEKSNITSVKSESDTSDYNNSIKSLMESLEQKEPLLNHLDKPGIAHLDKPEMKHSETESSLKDILNLLKKEK